MTARAPTMTAMTAATLDILSEGRVLLGLGLSGPQVVEGWYGVRYDQPIKRTREYIEIVRRVLAREGPLEFDGDVYKLPLADSQGKALKLITHPLRADIPIYLAAIGPKNVRLAGELADGWLPAFFSPEHSDELLENLGAGAEKANRSVADIDIAPNALVSIGDDLESCFNWLRPAYGLYLGGMGSKKANFYNRLASSYGFEDEATKVQELFLSGDRFASYEAIPKELMDITGLAGPPDRVAERIQRYEKVGVGTLIVNPMAGTLEDRVAIIRQMKEIVG